ncbi:restriction endonuclease subunit S [Parabacteroides sp. OF04-13BH]|uniref:restriction endonuclease subunit S n=1 Tax=Parabacteroides sp. OF04-13BH TaxID=2293124 RepID=UPI001F4665F8|nr:restriction endonuclease subunit S [Parabacteroides sp. OF04-13BH]
MRFPEFTDEWKESVLSDFVERVKRKNKNNLCKLPLTISAQYGLVDQISFFNKVIASENMSNYYLLHKGDFAYNKSYSSEYPWGAIKRLDCYEQGTLSSLYICFKPYSHVSSDFLTHYFETSKWHQGISEIAVEGARNHGLLNVGIQDFFETRHCLPQSLLEQEKIAKFLNLIEERIATQNKIIEKLQSLIKGLRVCCMQRVYGNNVYLSEIAQIYQPQTISSTELTEDGFLVYGANGIIGKYKDYNHETEQICITCRGNTCGMVNYTKPMSWITGNAMVINTDKYQDKVCKRYLYHYLSAYNFNSIISGSGQPQIVRTPLEKLKITLPTISEQKQKAIIFDKIQDKIDINHKVLNLYIGQKQYLLRQMFI